MHSHSTHSKFSSSPKTVLSSNFVFLVQDPIQDHTVPVLVIALWFPLFWNTSLISLSLRTMTFLKSIANCYVYAVLTNWNYFYYNFVSFFPLNIIFSAFSHLSALTDLSVIILNSCIISFIFSSLLLFLLFLVYSVLQIELGITSLEINLHFNFNFWIHLSSIC